MKRFAVETAVYGIDVKRVRNKLGLTQNEFAGLVNVSGKTIERLEAGEREMVQLEVYCGLLGCGKTTLIKQMLKTVYCNHKVAIIENEIGKVNIDAGEFADAQVTVTQLTAGCICCTIKGDFTQAVNQIIEEQNVEYIILEATGAADIEGLLEACGNVRKAQLHRLVMVVNAKKLKPILNVVGEFYRQQIRLADVIFLNFTEQLEQEKIQEARELLLELNPRVRLIDVPVSEVDASTFGQMEYQEMQNQKNQKKSRRVKLSVGEAKATPQFARMAAGAQKKLYTWSYEFMNPCGEEMLQEIKALLHEPGGSRIWRAKGILQMQDGSLKKLDLAFGDFFEENRDPVEGQPVGTLVLIGDKLEVPWLEKKFIEIDRKR